MLIKFGMGAALPRRSGGANHYYERISVEEQNERLRERLRRSKLDIEYVEAEKRELEDEAEQLRKDNARLHRENDTLRSELEYFKNQLRPRTTQNPERKPIYEAKQLNQAPKKIGAKVGHVAHKRKVPVHVDQHVKIVPDHCPNCESKLPAPSIWHSHTQIDLPEPSKPITTQYHIGWSHCSECKQNVSIADSQKLPRSKYGPRLHALVGYWKFGMGLTLPKIRQMLLDQYEGLDVSTGEISEMLSNGAAKFFYPYQDLKNALRKETVVYADETGWRRAGKNAWLWSFSSNRYSYYAIEKGRSRDIVQEVLGDKFQGILSSDFLGSYTQIRCKKQKCWVHLLRKVKSLNEKYPNHPEVVQFSERIHRFYERATELARRKKAHRSIEREFKLLVAHTDTLARKRWDLPDLNTLGDRLRLHRDSLYTFIHAGIDPHNNAAEREIRPAVLMRKTSYGNRSMRGAETQAIWMSLIRTCHKQSKPFMKTASEFIKMA